ncbi:MAG: hypothetical protein MI922_23210 [Bacteroidales bacterium]|nr:hypothetical protein [Bacteroidales bacterium]
MIKLGIVDIREIVRIIKENHNFDLSKFALTALKYRLEKTFVNNNIKSVEVFLRRLGNEPQFFDAFIGQVLTPSTEMFRDPSVWRWIREKIITNLSSSELVNFKIWIPYSITGGELYTVAILLKESGILDRTKIYCTCHSEYNIQQIKAGKYPLKKIDVSTENYKRFQGAANFNSYYEKEDFNAQIDTTLIENVEFIKDDFNYSKAPKNLKLIIYRNVMIYLNPTHQNYVLDVMYNNLSATGYMAIGIKENLRQSSADSFKFEPVNEVDKIYRRKLR